MRWLLVASLLGGCGALDVPPRGPLARYDLLFTSVDGDAAGDITGFDSLQLLHPDGTLDQVVEGERGNRIRDAAWSPDGRSIAYTASTTDPYTNLQRYHVSRVEPGALPRVIARVDGPDGQDVWRPRWSPDGRRLVASISVPAEGASRGKRTRVLLLDAGGGDARLLSPSNVEATDPEWSADGHRVFYLASQATEVWSVDPDGGEPELVTSDGAGIASFAVSPRGDALLLSNYLTTYLVDPLTHELLRSIDLGWGLQYVYSPDGGRLAFVRNVADENLLFTYGANGTSDGEARHLHDCGEGGSRDCTSRVEGQFSWSPDSRWLALGSAGRIYVVRAEDGLEIAAPSGNRVDSNPQWRPR